MPSATSSINLKTSIISNNPTPGPDMKSSEHFQKIINKFQNVFKRKKPNIRIFEVENVQPKLKSSQSRPNLDYNFI
jgi:hypothetical protein